MRQPTVVQWTSLAILLLTVLSESVLLETYRAYLLLGLALANAVLAWLNGQTAKAHHVEARALRQARERQEASR